MFLTHIVDPLKHTAQPAMVIALGWALKVKYKLIKKLEKEKKELFVSNQSEKLIWISKKRI